VWALAGGKLNTARFRREPFSERGKDHRDARHTRATVGATVGGDKNASKRSAAAFATRDEVPVAARRLADTAVAGPGQARAADV